MSFQMPPDPEPRRPAGPQVARRRRSRALLPTLVVLGVLLAVFGMFTGIYTDYLWFQSVDYTSVFTTELLTRSVLFAVFGLLMAGVVVAGFAVAYRFRPPYMPMSPEQQNLERYRQSVEPFRRLLVAAAAGLIGLIAGSTAASEWQTFLLWRNGEDFGVTDPQFGRDVAFFVFDLPWYRFLIGFGFAAVVVSLFAAVATHYLYGGLRLQTGGDRTTPAARAHLSVLLGLFVLLKAIAYVFDRWSLAVQDTQVGERSFVGLTYTDVNAVLPAKYFLAAAAAICAVLFFINVFRRGWLLAGVGVGLLALSAVLIGTVYPGIIQRFTVAPSEQSQEAEFLQRHIDATTQAYNIDTAEYQDYDVSETVSPGQLRDDADTIPGIRLLDPTVVPDAYRQLQQVRPFYSFPDILDVDRYPLDGQEGMQDAVVAVRELNVEGIPQRNWVNERIIYTHGFGFVAARGNTRDAAGRPSFFEGNIPPDGLLVPFQPRIYFGEQSPTYSIVGAPEGAPPRELDRPGGEEGDDASQTNNTYDGAGGVPIGSTFRRLLYSVKYQEENILLSNFVNEESKILYDRHPRDRIEKVAPWLRLDGNAYPAVVDDKVVWILDGYTTTNSYPYANRTALDIATEDALTETSGAVVAQIPERVNYMRNSVKATVDAYDGTVTLYEWGPRDPVLETWKRAFPGTVTPESEISEDLRGHLRYPEDLFKVQRAAMALYHVTDPGDFYSGQDFWRVPEDPVRRLQVAEGEAAEEQPAYYLSLQMPGTEESAFSLTTTFVPSALNRQNLTAFAAVNAEPGEDYGQMRALVMDRNISVAGPGQVQNAFQSDPNVAERVRLLSSGEAQVQFGNLLTLPVGGGLLYVEPLYVRSAGATASSFPLLQQVIVGFGDRIAIAPTLQEALDEVFGGDAGTETDEPTGTVDPAIPTQPDPETPVDPQSPAPPPAPTEEPTAEPAPPAPGSVEDALAQLQAAFDEADAALQAGDLAGYQAAVERAQAALEAAVAAGAVPAAAGTPAAPPAPGGG